MVLAVRRLRDELEFRFEFDPRSRERYLEGDSTVVEEATTAACSSLGIRPEVYRCAIDSDASLVRLETESILEVSVGSADPGPYDTISSESPWGSDDDEHRPL